MTPRIDPHAVICEILGRHDEREIVFDGARLADAKAVIRSFVQGAPEPVVDRIEGLLKRAVRVRLVSDRVSPRPEDPPQPVLSAAGYSLGRAWFIDQPTAADAPVRSGRELLTC